MPLDLGKTGLGNGIECWPGAVLFGGFLTRSERWGDWLRPKEWSKEGGLPENTVWMRENGLRAWVRGDIVSADSIIFGSDAWLCLDCEVVMSMVPGISCFSTMQARIGCASALLIVSGALGGGFEGLGSADSQRVYAAELRSEAYAEGELGGWSPDQVRRDNSSMRMSVLMQARYMVSNRRNTTGATSFDSNTIGFDLPRTQLTLEGSIVSSQLTYRLTMDFGDAELARGRGTNPPVPGGGGSAVLLDAYAQYNFAEKREGYYLKAGQFKNIMHTEEAVEAPYQLAVERSLTNEFFNHGYTQGVALGRVQRNWAWEVSVTDGGRFLSSQEIANTSFTSPFEADFAIAGRIDRKIRGNWEQFVDFTSFQGSQEGLKVGAGMMWLLQGDTNPGGFTPPLLFPRMIRTEMFSWTVDVQYEGDGWNVFAAYMGNTIDWEFAGDQSLYLVNHGFVMQGGYFMTDKSEFFVRTEGIWYDDEISVGFGVLQGQPAVISTVGWNYYIVPESHAAKVTVDASVAWDDSFGFNAGFTSSDTLPDPGVTGFLGQTNTEYVLRAQLQILF